MRPFAMRVRTLGACNIFQHLAWQVALVDQTPEPNSLCSDDVLPDQIIQDFAAVCLPQKHKTLVCLPQNVTLDIRLPHASAHFCATEALPENNS